MQGHAFLGDGGGLPELGAAWGAGATHNSDFCLWRGVRVCACVCACARFLGGGFALLCFNVAAPTFSQGQTQVSERPLSSPVPEAKFK